MSALIHTGALITARFDNRAELTVRVDGILFEGTSRYVAPGGEARWRELVILQTPAGIVLRDRVREHRGSRDMTVSCDWQLFENAARCASWLKPDNKLESRARLRLVDMLPPAQPYDAVSVMPDSSSDGGG